MMLIKKFSALILLVFSISSCSNRQKTPYSPPEELAFLLTGDSAKTWKLARRYNGQTRMNMGDCFLGYRQTFKKDGTVTDNNSLLQDCGKSLAGGWKVISDSLGYTSIRIESPFLSELMNIEENYKDFRIFYIDNDSLHISFIHKQFGEQRRISDYLVRDSIPIKDRDFHY